jgi:hypothetical protein
MRLAVLAIAVTLLVGGCGRYEGTTRDPSVEGDRPQAQKRDEGVARPAGDSKDRTLRVIVRDLQPLSFYDANCKLIEDAMPKLEVYATPAAAKSTTDTFHLPVAAQKAADGCEAPAILVSVPNAEEYSIGVSMEGQGLASPDEPIYPDTFHVPSYGGQTATVVVFE